MANGYRWTPVGGQVPGGFGLAAALVNGGKSVLITGGTQDLSGASQGRSDAWMFTERSPVYGAMWVDSLPFKMNKPRFGHTATTLLDGKILIAGSNSLLDDGLGPVAQTAELYDPATKSFGSTQSSLIEARGRHTATRLLSGDVLVVGGEDPKLRNQGQPTPKTSAEIYDCRTRSFRLAKGSLHHGQSEHTATLLDDGTVLVVGGGFAERFYPDTETFVVSAQAPTNARWMHAAVKLGDGRVLLVGGYEYGQVGFDKQCEEVYDPSADAGAGAFAQVPSLGKTAYGLTLSLLHNGKVLVVGGTANRDISRSGGLTIDDHYHIFDPALGGFEQPPLGMDRIALHTASVLVSGSVFVVGGVSVGRVGALGRFPNTGQIYGREPVSLSIRFHGEGKVAIEPGGIVCSADADARFAPDTTLSALASGSSRIIRNDKPTWFLWSPWSRWSPWSTWAGWSPWCLQTDSFDGWGADSAARDMSNPLTVVMNGDRTVHVNFKRDIAQFVSPWEIFLKILTALPPKR